MKKQFLFLLSFSMVNCYATVPLVNANNSYRSGDILFKQQVAFKDAGSSGKSLEWDFSVLQTENDAYELTYFIPDSSFMNIVCGQEHDTRYYFRQERDSVWAIGYENSTTLMNYIDPELKMVFPFSYGDTLYSNFFGEGEYSHRMTLTVEGFTRTCADAEGKLILPDITISNALRVNSVRQYTEVGRSKVGIILNSYAWYSPKCRYPVFESITTSLCRENSDTVVYATSFYYPPHLQRIQTDEIIEPNAEDNRPNDVLSVFTEATLSPNPVHSELRIGYKLTRAARISFSVHTNAGVAVCQTPFVDEIDGFHATSIDMSQLISGVYTLNVHVDDMLLVLNVIKI